MSWDVRLRDQKTGHPAKVSRHQEGGTYCWDGSGEAILNVTYNYSEVLVRLPGFGGSSLIRIHGLTGKEANEEVLTPALNWLGDIRVFRDYWAPTLGNVAHALRILSKWAKQYPDAMFEVD